MAGHPELFAVVVNWNLKEDTIRCAASLLAGGVAAGHVIVVDNGSTDGSAEAILGYFGGDVRLVRLDENLGFTGGVNHGVRLALECGAGWVLLVNNDTEVDPGMVPALLDAAQDGYSLLGPAIYYYDDPQRIWFFGDLLLPGTLFTRGLFRGRVQPKLGEEPVEVHFLSGCGLLVRREVFETAGLFDTSLFMYGEEVDFCWRARLAGHRLAAVPGAKMWHKVSRSARRDRPRARFLRVRNQIWFYRRYALQPQRGLMWAGSGLRTLVLAAADLLRGDRELAGVHLRGWQAGWGLNPPEYPANTQI